MQYTDITSRALTYLLRSPHLHIDMTEAIYRGLAEICCAQPDGVLLRLRAPWNGRPFLYECSAATPERSAALLEQLGMHCRTCPAAARETLEQACRLHKQDCGALVKNLNAYFLFRP